MALAWYSMVSPYLVQVDGAEGANELARHQAEYQRHDEAHCQSIIFIECTLICRLAHRWLSLSCTSEPDPIVQVTRLKHNTVDSETYLDRLAKHGDHK